MAGRKPTPTALKIVKGTDQPSRINKREPKPKGTITKPRTLSKDASKHWNKVVKQLKEAGIMTPLDADALAAYCEVYARWITATNELKKGMIIKAPSGYPIQSPYLQIANKCFDQMRAMLTEFGMTPSSRTRVSIVKDESSAEDPWDDL